MVKAIETIYNGYRFRSRLEARWAVFFDMLNIKYHYELQGFDLDEFGYYLPDFFIPSIGWIEIKPPGYDGNEWPSHPCLGTHPLQMNSLMDSSLILPDGQFFMIVGEPGYVNKGEQVDDFTYDIYVPCDCFYRFCECPDCNLIGIQFEGRSDRLSCKECYLCSLAKDQQSWRSATPDFAPLSQCTIHGDILNNGGCPRHGGNKDRGHNYASARLLEAYDMARQARFEHGEHGYR